MTTMISYAQNFEDVMLWRCFKNIENGFYIDVGANDPVLDSVSLAFYNRGWRGINIEPSTDYYKKLIEARPDEQVIQAALGAEPGEVTFYDIPSTGLSTTDLNIAKDHENKGLDFVESKIRQTTLDDIFSEVEQDVYWLKIDVEGAEKAVLDGWRDSPVRPWVLVIESTLPRSEQESYASWENQVLDKGYEFVYFDGLNRFYLSQEHLDLKKHFRTPPNVFDDFIIKTVIDLKEELYSRTVIEQRTNEALQNEKNENSELSRQLIYQQKKVIDLQNEVMRLQEEQVGLQNKLMDKKSELISENNYSLHIKNKIELMKEKLINSQIRLEQTEMWGNSINNRLKEVEMELDKANKLNDQLKTQVDNILFNFYYRITYPLRSTEQTHNKLLKQKVSFKESIKKSLNKVANFISKYPKLHKYIVKVLKLFRLHGSAKNLRIKVANNENRQHALSALQENKLINNNDVLTANSSTKYILNLLLQQKMNYTRKGRV